MNYDFQTLPDTIRIPKSEYRPIKRCPYCKSVFLTDKSCESCGRSLLYHPIGEPFGAKSFYGMKERYIENQNALVKFFPIYENKNSNIAKSYVRNLSKRFTDLVSAFNSDNLIESHQRKLFYVESIEIIDELLLYGVHPELLQGLLFENDNSLLGQELLFYLQGAQAKISADVTWQKYFLDYRFFGILRVEYILKIVIVSATVVTMAVKYKEIISSQFGK